MKALCSQPGRLLGGLVVVTLLCFALTPNLAAQTNTAGIDPGPRPPGTSPFLDTIGTTTESVCTIIEDGTDLFKFNPFTCFDQDQPPSNAAQPPAAGAGQLIANPGSLAGLWGQGLTVFSETATVIIDNGVETITGLGPSFNGLSCFACHAEPAVGGASPGLVTVNGNTERTTLAPGQVFNGVAQNPEYQASIAEGASNTLPCFIVPPTGGQPCNIAFGDFPTGNFSNGPVVEVRFPGGYAGDSTNDIDPVMKGAVADLFTIETRADKPAGCTIGQEPITAQIQANNAIFRTPTPTFGLGFVENTPELTLTNNLATVFPGAKKQLGISGAFNRIGNDQTITRFGWKAQNKSLMMFAGEASNVEMGVTNELFPNERTTGSGPDCTPNQQPEDEVLGTATSPGDASQISSVLENNAVFMRLNAAAAQCDYTSTTDIHGAPVCKPLGNNALQGQCFFGSTGPIGTSSFCTTATQGLPPYGIGCVLCHSDNLSTANSSQPGLANVPYAPYSDFAIHIMGSDNDGVTQGLAVGNQFRTAPLWGAGQRFFFMHSGTFTNLDHAIRAHCPSPDTTSTNESCAVIQQYEKLPAANQTLILEFLRSL